jgi:glycosyltransferase involved in cell wall biosynthesis
MLQAGKTKICLVGDALSGGGAERAHAFLSVYFATQGIEVHNVVVQDMVTYPHSGALLNLGKLKNRRNDVFDKFKRFRILRSYIKTQHFDYIIDFRMRQKPLQDWLISKVIYTAPAVYTVHSSVIDWYMPSAPWLTRAIYNKAYGVISITFKIKDLIEKRHRLTNVVNIYNPIDTAYIGEMASKNEPAAGYDYIVAAGSMGDSNIKQFDKLIEAYAASVLPAGNCKLLILGRGSQKQNLEKFVADKGLSGNVIFKGFQENPYVYMRNALFYVLSSKYEGLPMVLLEALACGTPVIAFDCFTGPSEIITDEANGLLIEDQDVEKLTAGMNRMFTDTVLYNHCRQNAVASIEKFSLPAIGAQWMEYLKIEK